MIDIFTEVGQKEIIEKDVEVDGSVKIGNLFDENGGTYM